MTRDELECAIRKPAEKIQLEFEPGLVRRIINEVGDEPGNLQSLSVQIFPFGVVRLLTKSQWSKLATLFEKAWPAIEKAVRRAD